MRFSARARRGALLSLLPAAALWPLACHNPEEFGWAVERGTIVTSAAGPIVDVPSVVVAGEPAAVTVYTFGDGCVTPAYTNSTVTGALAVVEPFDSVIVKLPANHTCGSKSYQFAHSAAVVFAQAGSGTIRIIGWNEVSQADDTLDYAVSIQ
jgi:hypothetical protein